MGSAHQRPARAPHRRRLTHARALRRLLKRGGLIFPREHGAYGQLAFPLITSFAVAGVSTAALVIAASAIAGFLAHEPLLVILGRRGARAKRDTRRRAIIALTVEGLIGAAAGVTAIVLAPREIRWSLLVPLVPAAVLAIAIVFEHEKRALGEVAAALTFSSVAIPVCLAAGASWRSALSITIAFAAIFVTATLAVRAVILRARAGGNRRAERTTRLTVWLVAATLLVSLTWGSAHDLTPWGTTIAATPGLVGAAWLSIRPPSPAYLRTIGWTLVATAGAAAVVLIVSLS
jgi:YwiC-like protein